MVSAALGRRREGLAFVEQLPQPGRGVSCLAHVLNPGGSPGSALETGPHGAGGSGGFRTHTQACQFKALLVVTARPAVTVAPWARAPRK